ncbi:dna primase small subunit [Quercus suber]|uniref:DNA primase n=1 Tax=Quercus suber TaxID=58331 RepID=A0AAW0LUB8_QUESU
MANAVTRHVLSKVNSLPSLPPRDYCQNGPGPRLGHDFGFNHILWVYSGRRGVHCWVCDPKARRLTNEQRSSIAEYFRVYKGNENSQKKVSLTSSALHPFLLRSYKVLEEFFEGNLLSNQSLFSTEERYEKILEMIPDESITSELRGKWQDNKKSSISKENINVDRWKHVKKILKSGKPKAQGLGKCVEEIVFSFSYPRLDMETIKPVISDICILTLHLTYLLLVLGFKHMNHLLKAPFCIHPKTGRVCVPIDPNRCEEFDPTAVPTLSKVLEEINMGGLGTDDDEWDRTSLGKSIRFFRSSFLQPLLKSCKEEIENSYNAKLQHSKTSLTW